MSKNYSASNSWLIISTTMILLTFPFALRLLAASDKSNYNNFQEALSKSVNLQEKGFSLVFDRSNIEDDFSSLGNSLLPQIARKETEEDSDIEVPNRGRPGNRGDGGGRPANPRCPQMKQPLLALVPQTNWGETLASHPTFWLYVPSNGYMTFVLEDEKTQKKVYKAKFDVESNAGIISFKLPSDAPSLEVGKVYLWQALFYCDKNQEDFDFSVNAFILRVQKTDTLISQLKSAKTPKEKINVYAKNGLWHETITGLGNLRRNNTQYKWVKVRWNRLLEQDEIRFKKYDLTSEPIQNCCNIGK